MEDKKLDTIQEEASEVISLSNHLLIEDEETLVDGIDILTRIKSVGKAIKEEKDELLTPFKSALKKAQARFKPVEDNYKESESIVKGKIIDYVTDKENFSCEGNAGKISIRNLTKVVIADEEKLPSKYLMQVPNEKLIKEDLLNGVEVEGAKIEISKSVALLKK